MPLENAPRGEGVYTLQLRAPGSPDVSLWAEPVGARGERGVPLLLRPLDPSHIAELNAILDGPPPSLTPVSNRGGDELDDSVLFDPEQAIISVAPPRTRRNEDDTLTLPFRTSSH